MPRVKPLGVSSKKPVRHEDLVRSIIKTAMARNGIDHQRELIQMLNISKSALSRRMTGETPWPYQELHTLDSYLHFNDEEIQTLIRGTR